MVSEANILQSRSYESPVFTVESTIKPSAIIKYKYKTCFSSALGVYLNQAQARKRTFIFLTQSEVYDSIITDSTSRNINM